MAGAYDAGMIGRLSHTQLLRYAGLFTWAMVGIPLLLNSWLFIPADEGVVAEDGSVLLTNMRLALWAAAYFAFGLCYWLVTRSLGVRRPRWYDDTFLVMLTMSAMGVGYFSATGLGGILLLVVSGVLPWLLPLRIAIGWLVLQHMILVPVFTEGLGQSLMEAVLQSALYAGYASFAFVIGYVAKQQAQARDEQRRLNSELRATRALLAESTRMNERVRISRELHDLLGHHLTALSLNLEVASHLSTGRVQEHVRQSQTLAKLLLTDVREAVSQLREDGVVELTGALRTLTEGVPALTIELDIPERLTVDDPERAHVVLRCTQEIITNAVRHAQANRLVLRLRNDSGRLRIEAKDDGRGADGVATGHGLRGMRERLAAYGGSVDIRTARGEGFALDICLPLETPA